MDESPTQQFPTIRAAGTRTAKGVEVVARTIKRFMIHYDTDYHSACGMAMITCDEIWSEDELSAFADAYKILFDNASKWLYYTTSLPGEEITDV